MGGNCGGGGGVTRAYLGELLAERRGGRVADDGQFAESEQRGAHARRRALQCARIPGLREAKSKFKTSLKHRFLRITRNTIRCIRTKDNKPSEH